MLNDLLTGKASLEPAALEPAPQPAQASPGVCPQCKQQPAAPSGLCGPCVISNAQASARAQAQADAMHARTVASHRWIRLALIAVIVVMVAFIRTQMRREMREDSRASASPSIYVPDDPPPSPTSPAVSDASYTADRMCGCHDDACRSAARQEFNRFSQERHTVNAADAAQIAEANERYRACDAAAPKALTPDPDR